MSEATNDGAANYFAALAAIRLRALIRGERWPEPEDQFDLVIAAAMARLDGGRVAADGEQA